MTRSSSLKKTHIRAHTHTPRLPTRPAVSWSLLNLNFYNGIFRTFFLLFFYHVLLLLAFSVALYLNRTNLPHTWTLHCPSQDHPRTDCPSLPRIPSFQTFFNTTLLWEASLATPTGIWSLQYVLFAPSFPSLGSSGIIHWPRTWHWEDTQLGKRAGAMNGDMELRSTSSAWGSFRWLLLPAEAWGTRVNWAQAGKSKFPWQSESTKGITQIIWDRAHYLWHFLFAPVSSPWRPKTEQTTEFY